MKSIERDIDDIQIMVKASSELQGPAQPDTQLETIVKSEFLLESLKEQLRELEEEKRVEKE